jgi:hypothetical protein
MTHTNRRSVLAAAGAAAVALTCGASPANEIAASPISDVPERAGWYFSYCDEDRDCSIQVHEVLDNRHFYRLPTDEEIVEAVSENPYQIEHMSSAVLRRLGDLPDADLFAIISDLRFLMRQANGNGTPADQVRRHELLSQLASKYPQTPIGAAMMLSLVWKGYHGPGSMHPIVAREIIGSAMAFLHAAFRQDGDRLVSRSGAYTFDMAEQERKARERLDHDVREHALGDAPLFEAETRLVRLYGDLPNHPDRSDAREALWDEIHETRDIIDKAQPRTLAGAAAMLRSLLDPENGDYDEWLRKPLAAVLDAVEREAGKPTHETRPVARTEAECVAYVAATPLPQGADA